MKKININEKFSLISEYWTPKIIAQSNDQLIKIAKGRGEIVWHKHENEDELFIVFKGKLTIQLREKDIVLKEGEMFVVSKGIEHCPFADTETHFMMIEPTTTRHTGDVKSDQTVPIDRQVWI